MTGKQPMHGNLTARQRTGRAGEAIAATYARQRGWLVLEVNVRLPSGEIDLVVRDGAEVVLVEVRTRRGDDFGTGAESLSARKRARMETCAHEYMAARSLDPDATPWRVDLVAVRLAPGRPPEVEHLPHVLAT